MEDFRLGISATFWNFVKIGLKFLISGMLAFLVLCYFGGFWRILADFRGNTVVKPDFTRNIPGGSLVEAWINPDK